MSASTNEQPPEQAAVDEGGEAAEDNLAPNPADGTAPESHAYLGRLDGTAEQDDPAVGRRNSGAREIPLLALRSVLLPGETLPLMLTDPADIAIIEAAIAGQEEARRRAQQKQQQCEDELCAADSGLTAAADTSDEPAAAATFGVVVTRHFRRRVTKLPASVIGQWLINPEDDTCLHAVQGVTAIVKGSRHSAGSGASATFNVIVKGGSQFTVSQLKHRPVAGSSFSALHGSVTITPGSGCSQFPLSAFAFNPCHRGQRHAAARGHSATVGCCGSNSGGGGGGGGGAGCRPPKKPMQRLANTAAWGMDVYSRFVSLSLSLCLPSTDTKPSPGVTLTALWSRRRKPWKNLSTERRS